MVEKQYYENELISCIVPTYKRSDSLLRAVNSILKQTYTNIEVLVVDDNEPDDDYSLAVQKKLDSISDSRLRYIQQERHTNGAIARNFGVKHSKGEYIAFLDDDDEWLPNKLTLQLEEFAKLDDTYGAVSCLTKIYKHNNQIRVTPSYSEKNLHKKVLEHSVSVFTGTVLFKKEYLIKTGFFNETLERHQDLQLFVDFLAEYNMYPMNKPLMISHIDDTINRPNTVKLIKVKEIFFDVMTDDLQMYGRRERKNIKASHYFEIIFSALKERKFEIVIKYILKIGVNPQAYINVTKRFLKRKTT